MNDINSNEEKGRKIYDALNSLDKLHMLELKLDEMEKLLKNVSTSPDPIETFGEICFLRGQCSILREQLKKEAPLLVKSSPFEPAIEQFLYVKAIDIMSKNNKR